MPDPYENWVLRLEGFLIVLNRHTEWSTENFDRLAEVWDLDPADDRLIGELIDRGWAYSESRCQYVRVDIPEWVGSRFDRPDVI
jgi:hypothetical protein